MTPVSMQRLGVRVGNSRLSTFMGPAPSGARLQRVPVSYPDTGETLYENPSSPGATAASQQFEATGYGGGSIDYDIERTADHAVVTVRVQFVSQPRGENRWLVDKAGKLLLDAKGQKQPDPTFAADVGTPKEIPAGDKRRDFATAQCESITKSWNHYDLTSKTIPKAGQAGPDGTSAPAPPATPVTLPLKFVAKPEFALGAKGTHTTIRVYGEDTVADRDGAHPVDSGHWYMNTKANYGDMDLHAISAHEYGHLIGLQDEYFRSDDQTHQMLHKMGGGAKNADAALDQNTLRIMVTAALYPVIESRLTLGIDAIAATFATSYPLLRKQLTGAVRSAWADAGLRAGLVKQIEPALKSPGLKRQLPAIVAFETGENLSNVTRASDALASTSVKYVESVVLGEFLDWQAAMSAAFSTTGADGSSLTIGTEVSSNVSTYGSTGAGKAAAAGIADTVIGGGAPTPKIAPSSTLLGQLADIPKQWETPGKGLDSVYTAAYVGPQISAAADAAVATGAFGKTLGVGQLYLRVLKLVDSTVRASATKAARSFVDDAVHAKVEAQLMGLKSQIETEVAGVLGMKAGALAAKSPADPNVTALATKLHTMLTSQQAPGKYDSAGEITPGAGSAGMDVRHSSSSIMSANDVSKAGFRSDLIQPVVDQFNSKLKHADEESFTAKVSR
ncbi:hypothetical protein FHP29_12660 [Nocardioides albidus]|uniref:Uncharacterized protein n=1 Tax=Nocardioides albidus TaxID=1517589 RepID=A0A5C4VVB2_9ACTN|nr:hypothetical protein [Nocardioides albidus]TNM39711.1 hypothetical protein FHP29_12660 [Nocardioides albidus]